METQTPPAADNRPLGGSIGGILPMMGVADMQKQAQREARVKAERENNAQEIQSLAGHVKRLFSAARDAREVSGADKRMLMNLRQKRGEYEADDLSEIRKTGGSEIYMMLTSNKCRAAAAWLKDIFLGQADDKPWGIFPTPMPELNPEEEQSIAAEATQTALQMEMQMDGQVLFDQNRMNDLVRSVRDRVNVAVMDKARKGVERMETKMEDQLAEGNFIDALAEFIDDLVVYPSAILKGPVVRKRKTLSWPEQPDDKGNFEPVITEEFALEWERVDPYMIYPSPDAAKVKDGYLCERHRLSRGALIEMKDVEGYSNAAIDGVLEEHGRGGLRTWLSGDTEKAIASGKDPSVAMTNPDELIDAIQFWGSVQGQLLIDWGMKPEQVPDPLAEHSVEVWLVGNWVIKAVLNADPFSRRPYYKASYEELPGSFWGNSVCDLIRDCQRVCNATARALSNNMGMASGPQVGINISRLPDNATVTKAFPWKVWQFTSDPYGSSSASDKPIEFFQPQSNAEELMRIYEKFSVLADEYSGLPRYMTGDARTGGAGRTASGMSMLMSNAGKALKQVVTNVDLRLAEAIERLYYYNMRFGKDPELKRSDIKIIARGAKAVIQKEQLQVRRNEFLQLVLSSPVTASVIGPEAIAEILRETAKDLEMNTDKIIPPPEVIRFRIWQQQQAEMMAQAMAANQPTETMEFDRDEEGNMRSMRVMPGNKQTLQNGAPVADNFSPKRGGL